MTEPYGVEPEPTLPDLPGEIVHRAQADQMYDALAADLMIHAGNCVRSFGDFHLALSVGRPQVTLYLRLMTDPAFREFPWNRSHVWLTSEAEVPPGDARSRIAEIRSIFADHAGMPARHIHAVPWPGGAAAYEEQFQTTLAWREPGQDRLDAAVLGIHPTGEPEGISVSTGADEPAALVRASDDVSRHGEPPVGGVTLTPRVLRATRLIAVVGSGVESHAAVRAAENGGRLKFEAIAPVGGTLRWYIDGAAVSGRDEE